MIESYILSNRGRRQCPISPRWVTFVQMRPAQTTKHKEDSILDWIRKAGRHAAEVKEVLLAEYHLCAVRSTAFGPTSATRGKKTTPRRMQVDSSGGRRCWIWTHDCASRGRPPTLKRPLPGWQYVQVVKQRENGRLVGVDVSCLCGLGRLCLQPGTSVKDAMRRGVG